MGASATNAVDNGDGTWTITLDGNVTDDGLPNPPAAVTQTWTMASSPTGATATFANANAEDTTVAVDVAGDYTFTLTANDSALTGADTSNQITANVAAQPSSTLEWVLTDHLGSTAVTVNATTGTLTHRARHYPYGTTRTTSGTSGIDQTYTGQTNDPGTGLIDYNARQYDPVLGRFAQSDAITLDGLNRYSYVMNRPTVLNDPSGRSATGCEEAALIGISIPCSITGPGGPDTRIDNADEAANNALGRARGRDWDEVKNDPFFVNARRSQQPQQIGPGGTVIRESTGFGELLDVVTSGSGFCALAAGTAAVITAGSGGTGAATFGAAAKACGGTAAGGAVGQVAHGIWSGDSDRVRSGGLNVAGALIGRSATVITDGVALADDVGDFVAGRSTTIGQTVGVVADLVTTFVEKATGTGSG